MTDLTDMELHRLYECSLTSKYGLVDKGSPRMYQRLAARDLVEKRNDGYVITTLGLETLRINKDQLFGKRKRQHKKRFEEEDIGESDE